MDFLLGTILLWPLDWAPLGWMICDGRILQVNQYQALYALIGNTYGGTPPTTFALPDLRGRVPMGMSNNVAGRPNYPLGSVGGSANTTLTTANLPAHTHTATAVVTQPATPMTCTAKGNFTIPATSTAANATAPATNTYLAPTPVSKPVTLYNNTASSANIQMPGGEVTVNGTVSGVPNVAVTVYATGQGTPINNVEPYQTLNYIIAIEGLFPIRP